MKKILTLIALGSVAVLSANQNYQPYGNDGNYNQDQQGQSYSYQNDQYAQQGNQAYYQDQRANYGDNRGYNNANRNYDNNNRGYDNRGYDNSRNQKVVTDQDISKKLHDTLGSGWFSKGYQNVSYSVNNGAVTLTGYVNSINDRTKVEDSVRKIDGVRQVNNQIKVSDQAGDKKADVYTDDQLKDNAKKYPQDFAATPDDRQINARIRNKLSGGWFSKGVEVLVVRTNNGHVIISGVVVSPDDAQKVNDKLQDIDGVKSINNQLSVKENKN